MGCTRPSLQFRMANWSQVLFGSQWGKSLHHFSLMFCAFSVCDLILILEFYCELKIDYVLLNCKLIIFWFPILLSIVLHFCQFVFINTYETHAFICRITTLIESNHYCWSLKLLATWLQSHLPISQCHNLN